MSRTEGAEDLELTDLDDSEPQLRLTTDQGSAERGIAGIEQSQSEASSLRHRSSASDPVPTEEGFVDPRGAVSPVSEPPAARGDGVQEVSAETGEAVWESLPSSRYATLSYAKRRQRVNRDADHLHLLSQGSNEVDSVRTGPNRGLSRSLSERARRTAVHFGVPPRLSSSLPRRLSTVEVTILDDMPSEDVQRTSTMPLIRRMEYRRQRSGTFRAARVSLWGRAKDVWWPKFLSWLRQVRGWELWSSHLKVVESHFGSGVVSYFVFLRWLFLVNLLCVVIWVSFVCVPQFVWRATPEGQQAFELSRQSRLTCLLDPNMYPAHSALSCPSNDTVYWYRLCQETNVTSYNVSLCEEGGVVWRSNPTYLVVSDLASCNLTQGNGSFVLCRNAQPPATFPLQYIVDFITGQGIFNVTVLFIGQYFNGFVGGVYDLPTAVLLTGGVVYVVFIVLIIARMSLAFSPTNFSRKRRRVDYCNKVFSAWDCNITDVKSARLKRAGIKTELEETINDEEKRNRKRSPQEWVFVVVLRIFTNMFVLLTLGGGGVAIFYAVQFSSSQQLMLEGLPFDLGALLSPAVIFVLNVSLPFIYDFIARYERYKTQSGAIKITLFRAIIVRLASLIVLVISLFERIGCTQPAGDQCRASGILIQSTVSCRSAFPECWENVIGQELYNQVMFNFGTSLVASALFETTKKVGSKILNTKQAQRIFKGKKLGDKIPREFDIPKAILDLIYTQALLWLGFFFSPVIPFITTVNLFLLFYVRRFSLTINLRASKEGGYRAARTNFTFLLLLLAVLLGSLIPVGFVVAQLRPSAACGPFRGDPNLYTVIQSRIDNLESCASQGAASYFTSAGFIGPIVILLMMTALGFGLLARTRARTIRLLERQLNLESRNVSFLMRKQFGDDGDVDSVFPDTLQRTTPAQPTKGVSKARQVIQRTGADTTALTSGQL